MTPIKISSLIIIGITVLLLSGCMLGVQPTDSSITSTKTNEFIHETNTVITPTSIFTAIPTLSNDEGFSRLGEFLNNELGCRLPCWLGILPGHSSLLDLHQKMVMFSGITTNEYEQYPVDGMLIGRMDISYSKNDMVVEINSNFISFSGEDVVSVIGLSTRSYRVENGLYVEDVYGDVTYNKILEDYTLQRILAVHGKPSQVFLEASLRRDTEISPGYGDHFSVHLWYSNEGVFMEYKIPVEGSGNIYRFCPSNAFILGALLPTYLGDDYQELLMSLGSRYQFFFPPSENVKTLEEAFEMTIEEFYQLFITSPNSCVETPKAIWWP